MKPERPFSQQAWENTPEEVQRAYEALERAVELQEDQVCGLSKRVEQLEARLNTNSGNSDKPPSSDPPFVRPAKPITKSKRKRGAQKGHKGHHRKLLEPTRVVDLKPEACTCGCRDLLQKKAEPFYTHQVVELPDIQMDITHYRLHRAQCSACGKSVKADLPAEVRSGYGPRLSALIAQLSGTCGESRETVRDFVQSVLGVSISTGAVQRVIDRTSQALAPIHKALGEKARVSPINHVDETSWFNEAKLCWLWVMVNHAVAYFLVQANRSEQAFLSLIQHWEGILVSDNFSFYRKWVQLRQTCLAHLIRRARALAQRGDPELSHFGKRLVVELSLLCSWAGQRPTVGQWRAFYARFVHLLFSHQHRKDEAGKLARLLIAEMDCLWVFLEENGVEHTNNRAERALRFGVTWRKRSMGTQSQKGDRWVERILSLKHTCRMHGILTFPILVEAISSFFKDQPPDLSWLPQT